MPLQHVDEVHLNQLNDELKSDVSARIRLHVRELLTAVASASRKAEMFLCLSDSVYATVLERKEIDCFPRVVIERSDGH